jgi:hypothetical protein
MEALDSCTILHGLTIITWKVIPINHIESFDGNIHASDDVQCSRRVGGEPFTSRSQIFF